MDEQRGLRMGGDGTCLHMTKTSLLKTLRCTGFLLALTDGYCYGRRSSASCFYPDISQQCLRTESQLDRREEAKAKSLCLTSSA